MKVLVTGGAGFIGYEGVAHYAPMRKGGIQRICLDYTKATGESGWLPRVGLGEGVRRAVEYYGQYCYKVDINV